MVKFRTGFVLSVTLVIFGVTFYLICLMVKFRTGFVLYVSILMFQVAIPMLYVLHRMRLSFSASKMDIERRV